ncbi:AbrB/MazE/SpoVT family DNA-binding domain-containing protein [Haladaptatus halobius]|uniref:AbrB/MazE/SpoVT family DNA-binding domain-containing protein n=1 Tax=Haladaptatus halobius TaxID=2884875 RepID=UPI001D09EA54|nr:AbrB/MazE/SpoVT family DNA-binding domain-containing protein [Haladaptatus halobius]
MVQNKRRVGDRGQVTIPKWIREQENIHGGDEVVVERDNGQIVIRKADSVDDDDLAQAYRDHAEEARRINDEWEGVSSEANDSL